MSTPYKTQKDLFGQNMQRCRLSRKLTQVELGLKIGTDGDQIQKYESGARVPSFKRLLLILDALDVPLEQLVGKDNGVNSGSLIKPGTDPLVLLQALADVFEEYRQELYRLKNGTLQEARQSPDDAEE